MGVQTLQITPTLGIMDFYFIEDCPYEDETTELLRISGTGEMRIVSRSRGVMACIDDLQGFYSRCNIETIQSVCNGCEFKEGEILLEIRGDLKALFKVWRVSQTFLSITCAIATKTRRMVNKARSKNPSIIISSTRKTHPGMRYFEQKAVRIGGGACHRNSLSDSILITQNHLSVLKKLPRLKGTKRIKLEPRNEEEALLYASVVDELQLDHFTLETLRALVPQLRDENPRLCISVSGNITEENIGDYSEVSDVVVTSSLYYIKPLDFTTEIERTTVD